jgi:hypothetical protein
VADFKTAFARSKVFVSVDECGFSEKTKPIYGYSKVGVEQLGFCVLTAGQVEFLRVDEFFTKSFLTAGQVQAIFTVFARVDENFTTI